MKWRFKVIAGKEQLIIPCDEDSKISDLISLINKRAPGLNAKELFTADNYQLYPEDLICNVLDKNEIIQTSKITKNAIGKMDVEENMKSKSNITESTIEDDYTIESTIMTSSYEKKPFRILLVRHGESTANVDASVYDHTPEHRIPLSREGRSMARGAGTAIAKYFQDIFGTPDQAGRIRMWYSPYVRTWQTAQCILDAAGTWIEDMKEHPMLAELDYGLFEGNGKSYAKDSGYKKELEHYNSRAQHSGRFWARFPMGESPFDVCIRMQLFFGTLARGRDATRYQNRDGTIDTVVIVTHGVTLRAFVKMWTHKSQDWYENEWNPNNCAVRLITDTSGDEWYMFNGYSGGNGTDEAESPYKSAQSQKSKPLCKKRLSAIFTNPIRNDATSQLGDARNGVADYMNPLTSDAKPKQMRRETVDVLHFENDLTSETTKKTLM